MDDCHTNADGCAANRSHPPCFPLRPPQKRGYRKRLAAQYGMELFTDYQDFLKNGEFDTVYIGVINSEHFRYTEAALKAGKHVICEKPFTVKAEEANILKESALKNICFCGRHVKFPIHRCFGNPRGDWECGAH